MDEKRPKRRKDKHNPYTIIKEGNRYFLFFKDGQGASQRCEIDRPLFDLFNSFELEDLSFLNEWDRNIEQSDLSDISLYKRAFEKPASVEDVVISAVQAELLHNAIAELPEKQRRRFLLRHDFGFTYEQIAKIEGCKKQSICEAIIRAEEKIKEQIKFFWK